MKGFDPHLIKWLIIGLVFVVRAVIATNKKRQTKDSALRPPQSAAPPAPIGSPTMNQTQPLPRKPLKGSLSEDNSPWSSTKGPFDS